MKVSGRTSESLSVLHEAILTAEHMVGLDVEMNEAKAKEARTDHRLEGGYQVMGKFKSSERVQVGWRRRHLAYQLEPCT